VRGVTPKRFFAEHLEMFRLPNGENLTGYFDTFEEASKASDVALSTYSDPEVRANVRQEITDTESIGTTWVRLGDGPWSLLHSS
jgi:hypothetical protein